MLSLPLYTAARARQVLIAATLIEFFNRLTDVGDIPADLAVARTPLPAANSS